MYRRTLGGGKWRHVYSCKDETVTVTAQCALRLYHEPEPGTPECPTWPYSRMTIRCPGLAVVVPAQRGWASTDAAERAGFGERGVVATRV